MKEYINKKVCIYLFKNDNYYYEKINSLYKYLDILNLDDKILKRIIKYLSCGEKVKIRLLKLLINEYDILFLDEPTQNISPLSNPVIRKAFSEYKGVIISLLHDRKNIDKVANKLYKLTADGLECMD